MPRNQGRTGGFKRNLYLRIKKERRALGQRSFNPIERTAREIRTPRAYHGDSIRGHGRWIHSTIKTFAGGAVSASHGECRRSACPERERNAQASRLKRRSIPAARGLCICSPESGLQHHALHARDEHGDVYKLRHFLKRPV